ncbi:family 1 extracellular solute-binding protein [Niallia nealsonii AAU1]|nr:family 1 extracellular solute-binding protein [Niallia nealsonii AAU1]
MLGWDQMTLKKKIILLICTLLIIAISVVMIIGKGNLKKSTDDELTKIEQEKSMEAIEAYISGFKSESNYYTVEKQWQTKKIATPSKKYELTPEEMQGGKRFDPSQSEGYGKDVIRLEPKDELTFDVEIDQEGLYEFWLDYYILPETNLLAEVSMKINDEVLFNEMNSFNLSLDWQTETLDKGSKYDRYGDELSPKSNMVLEWKKEGVLDPNHFAYEPLKFKLNKGKNTIKLSVTEGYLLVGNIEIANTTSDTPTYAEYYSENKQDKTDTNKLITIEAENISKKNKQSIRPKYVRDPQITPYDYKNRILNVLDGYSFGDSGDRVQYNFEVEESGYYNITLKYAQDTNNGMPTFRRIEFDGKVPFKELELYMFSYSSSWKNELLKDNEGTPFSVYLEKGAHTLTLSINHSNVKDIYHELLTTLEAIDSVSKDVKKLTGGIVDKKREWRIERYIPEIKEYLIGISERIETQKKALQERYGMDDLPIISELEIAQKVIKEFIKNPEDLPHYMNKFIEDETSAYSRIKMILPMLVYNPMHLDKIYVHTEGEKIPKANARLFTSIVESTKAFTYSFFNPRYNQEDVVDDETIEVWVNQSRLYVELMQRMIDEEFTPNTGIKVNLSLLPDENKIILSNSANSTPDIALGVSHARPFELALRGIIEDLSKYDGFYELTEQFNPNTFVPFIYDEGVYAIPETQDVKLLFYRKDILSFLGETPPQTWEDVVGLVPMLQRYNMNFYTPLGSNNSFKGFDTTTPFIYQFGGRLFNEFGNQSVINKDGAYEAFDFMTSLFTVYNIPITTSEFFQNFRNGKSPVGIGDANTYIQLKYAAPELAGQWGVMPIPGVEDSKGVIERWDPTYGSTGIIFSDSKKKEESWELLKWWANADTQSNFSYNIQSILGNQFLYLTANIDGFKKSAWPSDSKGEILEQWNWIQTTGKVPGDYMVEREISNAWNKVVFDKENPRIAIDQAVKIIDRELERKLTEFGYMENGKLIKPYKVPTIENVEEWVRRNEKVQQE